MDRKGAWVIAGAILAGSLAISGVRLLRPDPPHPAPADGAGRFVIVKATEEEIVVKDEATGEQYSLRPAALKAVGPQPEGNRPGAGGAGVGPATAPGRVPSGATPRSTQPAGVRPANR